MTEYYKGQRVVDLLAQIDRLERVLKEYSGMPSLSDIDASEAWTSLAIAKAKLTALQGEK